MLEQLSQWESGLFFFINGHHSPFMDVIMWTFSSRLIWLPLAYIVLFYMYCKENRKYWLMDVLLIVMLLTVCDQVSSGIMKHYFLRLRPSHDPNFAPFVRLLHGYAGGQYGFPSSHATNSFGVAFFTERIVRDKRFSFFIYLSAFIISYSRVYLGVHFFSDIFVGAVIGLSFGYVFFCFNLFIIKSCYIGRKYALNNHHSGKLILRDDALIR